MEVCPKCGKSGFKDLDSLLQHIGISHTSEPSFSMACTAVNDEGHPCCKNYTSFGAYKSHMLSLHRSMFSSGREPSRLRFDIVCPTCQECQLSLETLATHYNVHITANQTVTCVIQNCNKKYTNYSSYRSHMSLNHLHVTSKSISVQFRKYRHVEQFAENNINIIHEDNSGDNQHDTNAFHNDNTNEEQDINNENSRAEPDNQACDEDCFKPFLRNMALCLLKMQEQYTLPASTVQKIVEDFTQLYSTSSCAMQDNLKLISEKHSLDAQTTEELFTLVDDCLLKRGLDTLSSQYRRSKYYKENFYYVEPVEYKYDDNSSKSFQYVPLLSTLKQLLEDDGVLDEVMKDNEENEGILSSFKDGTLYKTHPIFSTHDKSIQIILYSDEFEVVNPLAVHRGKHKNYAFYWLLGNLSPMNRSRKNVIKLLALCKSNDINEFGMDKLAALFNEELQTLETQGVPLPGTDERIFGALAFMAGDNLNSSKIGCFNCSFSPNVKRPCKYCFITNDQLQSILKAILLRIRTRADYDNQAAIVENDPSQSTAYGVTGRSLFNSGTYHVADGIAPDLAHDILEGTAPYELALFIKGIVHKRYATIKYINRVILTWDYGPLDKLDRPVAISEPLGDTVKQNAARCWCLIRLLPLMLGDRIPHDEPLWHFLIELKEIVDISFAFKLSFGHVTKLERLVEHHLSEFKRLFPGQRLKPKHHFLLHYGEFMIRFGPLRLCWCLAFESKHGYFTKLVKILHNYINVCSTLANRHQQLEAYTNATTLSILDKEMKFSTALQTDTEYLHPDVTRLLFNAGASDPIHTCEHVHYNGIDYHRKMYVIIGFDDFSDPVFGRIDKIFISQMECFFLVKKFKSDFDKHYCAFELSVMDDIDVCRIQQLVDYYPLTAYFVSGKKYCVLKNLVVDTELYRA